MPLSFVKEDGFERCYVNDAPSNEDCKSLARYFEKYWQASWEEEFDVGTNAKYKIRIFNQDVLLFHDSSLGNYLFCKAIPVSDFLAEPLADLDRCLSD